MGTPVDAWGTGRLTRRQAIRMGAGAAVSAGLVLAGCSSPTASAKATANEPHVHLFVMPWSNGPGGSSSLGQKLLLEGLQHWSGQFRNVDVHIAPLQSDANILVNSILTGTGPDVFEQWVLAPFFENNLALPISEYMRQDGVREDLWTPSLMPDMAHNGQLMALPAYTNIFAMTVNLSFFDSQGLPRPNPDWTYKDLQTLAPQIVVKTNGTVQPGLVIGTWNNSIGNRTWIYQAFGGSIINASGTKSTMSTPNSLAAGQWLYDGLVLPKLALEQNDAPDLPASVVLMQGTADVLTQVETYNGFLWDYYPMPYFPVQGAQSPQSTWRRATYQTDDAYLISATTRHPKHAWSLLRWLCADTWWQEYMFEVFLLAPSLNSLWPKWVSSLKGRVPPLASKNLNAFADGATQGWGFPQQYYAYNDAEAETVAAPFIVQIHAQTLSVTAAFQQIDHAVDAFEQNAAKEAGVTTAIAKAITSVIPGPKTQYPQPSPTGMGAAAVRSPYVSVQQATGTYTLLGVGSDIGGTSDDATFAAAATTATEGEWTCRLTALADVSETSGGKPTLSNWVRAGIMARGDLSDNAAMVLLALTPSYGFEFMVRPAPGAAVTSQKFLFWKTSQGLVQQLVSPVAQPASNYLIQPVWLRLARKGTSWTPSASVDGKTFIPLASPIVANLLAGAWMGVTVNAHNKDFNDQGYVRATFDDVTVTPTQLVQLGSSGVPPAAGVVPTNWATGNFQ